MKGLYIHIPFCKSRCIYCGFYSTTLLDLCDEYTDAVCCEMDLRDVHGPLTTLYIGGGTPSVLGIDNLHRLIERAGLPECELTVECNPEDVTPEFAARLAAIGVNRVSMGVQTFSDERLRFLNRRHSSAQAERAVGNLRMAGITNVSIDLIYGFPGQTLQEWEADLTRGLGLNPSHLSAYALSYENGTVLCDMCSRGDVTELDEELLRAMYERLLELTALEGLEHYEISNFALPGFRSLHNSNYWNATPYIGIGAGAHSYDGVSRSWNIDNVRRYMNDVGRGILPMEREVLDESDCYNELVMLGLRTMEGVSLDRLSSMGVCFRSHCLKAARPFIETSLLELTPTHLRLTPKGCFVSDMIIVDLMM